jgi:Tol biopolymer transport system component
MAITTHLTECLRCSTILADFRSFDNLLAHMPRISPSPALRDKIFSSPEYLELTGTNNSIDTATTRPYKSVRRAASGRPQLVALPGGRRFSTAKSQTTPHIPMSPAVPPPTEKRPGRWGLRAMQVTIAAALLLTLGVGSLIGWNLWLQSQVQLTNNGAITPPAGIDQHTPLSAGMRFVFLRDGALWSAPADGSTPSSRLTPMNVTVAANWSISPPIPGRAAGDMIAYIDLQRAQVHTIRSDGQRDTVVPQALLKAGISPASVWETASGEAILQSLMWSKDGSMLAFVADPTSTGTASLYILSLATGNIQMVHTPMKGNVISPVWSPDGVRIAFAVTHGSLVSVLDYNTQNNGLLLITNSVNSQAYPNDTLLTLDWSPSIDAPTITWSVGDTNQVHSIWVHHVGIGTTATSQLILSGQYAQAIYSRNGHGGLGSWLVVTTLAGHPANLLRMDVTAGAFPVILTSGKQIGFAQWSADGTQADYLDSIISNVGTLHVVNATTAVDTFIAQRVADEPAPAWSGNGQYLAYSTGTQVAIMDVRGNTHPMQIKPHGPASALLWSATTSQQLVVALRDGSQGTYIVDTQQNVAHQVDQQQVSGSVLWTEIP